MCIFPISVALIIICFCLFRSVSLVNSELIFSNQLIGTAVGKLQYFGITDGVNGTLSYVLIVSDSNGANVINSNQKVRWTSSSAWTDSGAISLQSKWSSDPKMFSWNANASIIFFDQQFAFAVYENATVGDKYANSVIAVGNGTYSGSWSNWEARLNDSYLIYNGDLVGSATGYIIGVTPNQWLDGDVRYQTSAKDASSLIVFTTNGESKWSTKSTWSEDGLIFILSEVFIQDTMNWNATGSVEYGDNVYSLYVLEKQLQQQSPTAISDSNLYAFFDGGYDITGWNDWYVTKYQFYAL
jgi:hypothetical protein